jgi:hypothetical protein
MEQALVITTSVADEAAGGGTPPAGKNNLGSVPKPAPSNEPSQLKSGKRPHAFTNDDDDHHDNRTSPALTGSDNGNVHIHPYTHNENTMASREVAYKLPHSLDAATSAVADSPTTTTQEGGLKLLFAASLLQKDRMDPFSDTHITDSHATMASHTSTNLPMNYNDMTLGEEGTSAAGPLVIVNEPTEMDVLCGRGGLINQHKGNVIYRKIVEYNKPVYRQVPKRYRILVPQSIVHTILQAGGRFLQSITTTTTSKNAPTQWAEIPLARATQKTSQALRERSRGSEDKSSMDDSDGEEEEKNESVSMEERHESYNASLQNHDSAGNASETTTSALPANSSHTSCGV